MLTHGALTNGSAGLEAQDHAGHTFGIVIVVVLALVTVAGFWAARAMDACLSPRPSGGASAGH